MIRLRTPSEQEAYIEGFKAGAQAAISNFRRGLALGGIEDYIASLVGVMEDSQERRQDAEAPA